MIMAGGKHSIFINNTLLYYSGINIGLQPTLLITCNTTIAGVYAGVDFSVFYTTDNLLYSFGLGANYRLGFGDLLDRIYPTLLSSSFIISSLSKGVPNAHTYFLNGTSMVTFGDNTVSFIILTLVWTNRSFFTSTTCK